MDEISEQVIIVAFMLLEALSGEEESAGRNVPLKFGATIGSRQSSGRIKTTV